MNSLQKTVLVTGNRGFIGKHLCDKLLSVGYHVIGMDLGSWVNKKANMKSYEVDIRNSSEVNNIIIGCKPNIIIHLAGGPTRGPKFRDYRDCFDLNQQGSFNVIEAALKISDFEKFIFMGSCEEYGAIDIPFEEFSRACPNTAYGLAKLSVTNLLQALSRTHKFPSVILRPSVVYGPGQKGAMFLPSLIDHLLNDQSYDMSCGDQTRDYVHIADLTNAIMLAMQSSGIGGEIFNISSNTPITIKTLATLVAEMINDHAIGLINFGRIKYRSGESMEYLASNIKSDLVLGWTPRIALNDGVRQTIEWHRSSMNC